MLFYFTVELKFYPFENFKFRFLLQQNVHTINAQTQFFCQRFTPSQIASFSV